MKVADLSGAELDYWAAKAEGFMRPRIVSEHCEVDLPEGHLFEPSSNWAIGGPIIERENIATSNHRQGGMAAHPEWSAKMLRSSRIYFGPTPLIAAMRAYVASKFGEEVHDEKLNPAN